MQEILSMMDVLQNELTKNGFNEHSDRVKQKQIDFNSPFMLMVIGEGNYGKSTLINALFNKEVAATSRLPKTWKIDLYENSKKEEALLFYKKYSSPKSVGIQEAVKICDEEELKSNNNELWKSDLFQVKWRIKTDWLENILLIDTPGFSQFRSNISYSNFNLFGTKGIQLQSLDGFEYYFYRADFVFWCIKATKLEDADTMNALKNISTDRNKIIGIITFMERIPAARWAEIKSKAEELYGSYIIDFLFFSPKETIDGLTENKTVDNIRSYINDKIVFNLDKLKKSSLNDFYHQELKNYCDSLDKTSDVYDKNLKMYFNLIEKLEKELNEIEKRAFLGIKNTIASTISSLEPNLNAIYSRSNDDPNNFRNLINSELMNSRLLQNQIEPVYLRFKDDLKSLMLLLNNKLEWSTLIITRGNSNSAANVALYNSTSLIKPVSNFYISFKIDFTSFFEAAFSADNLGEFLGNLFFGVINWLFGGSKQTKVVNHTKEELKKNLENIETSIISEIKNILSENGNILKEMINESFKDFHGQTRENLLTHFYWTDSITSNQLLKRDKKSVVDCLNDKKQLLTYFQKLLKYDNEKIKIWNKNADAFFAQEINKIFAKIDEELSKTNSSITRSLHQAKVDDPSIIDKKISEVASYLKYSILENPLLPSDSIIENLVYSDGNLVYKQNNSYQVHLDVTKKSVESSRIALRNSWDRKVDDLYNDVIGNIFSKVNEQIISTEQKIHKMIGLAQLSDLSLPNSEFIKLDNTLPSTILSNPFLSSKTYLVNLILSNGKRAYLNSQSYYNKREEYLRIIRNTKKELMIVWDQKIVDIIWDHSKDKLLTTFISNDSNFGQIRIREYCDNRAKLFLSEVYTQILDKTDTFSSEYKVFIREESVINGNLISEFQKKDMRFYDQLSKEINNDKSLSNLKSFNIPDISEFLNNGLQKRLRTVIGENSNTLTFAKSYKRFSKRIVLSLFPFIAITINYLTELSFLEDGEFKILLNKVLESQVTLIISASVLLLLTSFQVWSRLKLKKELRNYIQALFLKYGDELFKKFQKDFTNPFVINPKSTSESINKQSNVNPINIESKFIIDRTQIDKNKNCPNGHGEMQPWNGRLRCLKCGYPNN